MLDDDDDDERGMGPVIVRRSVHDAAEELRREMPARGGAVFAAAAERENNCLVAGNAAQAALWHDVSNYLQWEASVAASVETVILEDDEEWDREAGEKVRRRDRPPRSGKAT